MRPVVATLAVAALLPAMPARAQTAPAEQVILGRLLDDNTRSPIPRGAVRLVRLDSTAVLTVTTDSLGHFRMSTRHAGIFRLQAEQLGYRTATSQEIRLTPLDTLRVDFLLSPSAILLQPIVVTAPRTRALYYAAVGMEDFYRRMTYGRAWSGQYMTRDSIARWEHVSTTAMLATLPGVVAEPPGQITMRGCGGALLQGSVRWFVDGAPYELAPGQTIDNFFPPDQLEAIEVYPGQNVPGEFFGRSCGVVVLWLRRT